MYYYQNKEITQFDLVTNKISIDVPVAKLTNYEDCRDISALSVYKHHL